MPCYCDTPSDSDQKEIERRCKVRMYFDAQELLTEIQIKECQHLGLKKFPTSDINDYLCKLCKILSNEQMTEIPAYYYNIKWAYKTLHDWYMQHLKDDELLRLKDNK